MRNPAKIKFRTTAVMGLLLLGAGARFVAAQTPVPQQLNDLRKQVNQEAQPAAAQAQTKPSSPAVSTAPKSQANLASTANKPAQAKPSTASAPQGQAKTASATATPQTKPASPAASSTAKSAVNTSAPAPNKPVQAKSSNSPASPAQAKTASATSTNKPVDAKLQVAKPGAVPAVATAQAKPGARPPVKVVNVKPGATESPKAQPAAATTKTVSAPAAQPKVVPAVAAVPEVSHVARRDPFDPLVGKVKDAASGGPQGPLPAGKPGLVVATLRVDGIVKGTSGMIAIVSNPQMRVYFLREGDHLYDGAVEHITMEGVSFHETGKDAFGKSVEREVTKRLYPTPGEQQ